MNDAVSSAHRVAAIAMHHDEFISVRRIKLADGTYLDDKSMVWFAPGTNP